MSVTSIARLVLRFLPFVVSSPLFAAYGAVIVVARVLHALRRVVRALHILRRTLRCPHGHEVPVVGRFACSTCHSEYVGHIAVCSCGASADFTRCPECRVFVALPWSDR